MFKILDVLRAKEPGALIAESSRQRCISMSVVSMPLPRPCLISYIY
ncbi:hypothetical protein T05_4329 [Trichinella murrelli]|uniref:Uncharacterized protein n=1 Tax=Trichinella murrelli TaxID=144512 RepID=A0A0V0TVW2_9BILA|nr:hypothetical protein T05_4329 [Trichinella murrelli]